MISIVLVSLRISLSSLVQIESFALTNNEAILGIFLVDVRQELESIIVAVEVNDTSNVSSRIGLLASIVRSVSIGKIQEPTTAL